MKTSKFVLALMIALIAATAAGCSGGTETPQKNQKQSNATATEGQKIALPEEGPALIGKVKEIVGNEVTVFKGEIPQSQGTPTEQPANQSQNNQGVRPENRGMGMKFTEETETFLIPVGTPIVTMQRGTNEAGQVGLTEIKKDTILRVWKKDGTVSFVQVAGGNVQRGTGQGAGNNRQGAGTGAGAGGGMPPGMGAPPGMGGNR
ncbi:MAG: hypothetical protein ACOY40_00445 [Bacillota bacterium]